MEADREISVDVNRVQRFCLHDGPGIRTTVFLQGCSLHCWWCHNPDLQEASPSGASRTGVQALVETLKRDERYWTSSGGGVTLSGGEPLHEVDGCRALLCEFGRHGIHRCVDTSGAAPAETFLKAAPHVDLWLFDLKTVDPKAFQEATGGDLGDVMLNFHRIVARGDRNLWVRIPLIHEFNTDEACLKAIGKELKGIPPEVRVQVLPGHDLGTSKGRSARVSRIQCDEARRILSGYVSDVEVCW